jgi:hypothetical protein
MSSETALWQRVRGKIAHFGHFCRVESICTTGFPDVDYCLDGIEGHIELKFSREWPKRASTKVFKEGHNLREEQSKWLKLRLRAGAKNLFILAQCASDLFLFDINKNTSVLDDFNGYTQSDFWAISCWNHQGKMTQGDWVELIHQLSRRK